MQRLKAPDAVLTARQMEFFFGWRKKSEARWLELTASDRPAMMRQAARTHIRWAYMMD